jgi:hypothetical protein
MEKNKTGKYLKYAIGEIVLVVIGILIALSINNWNEDRKLRNQEFNILTEIKSNLETTLKNFENDTLYNLNTIQELYKIKRYIVNDLAYNNELDYAFGIFQNWSSPYPILNAYKTLQTKGLDIISNEKLRSDIVTLYDNEYDLLKIDYDKSEWLISQTLVLPFSGKHIRKFKENSKRYAKPNDFKSLKKNDEFMNILEIIISTRESGLRNYKARMEIIKTLISKIDAEINF